VREWLERLPALQEAFALIEQGHFSGGDRDLFRPLLDQLRGQDPFFVLADFDDYVQAQSRVDAVWLDRRRWTTMSLLNTARSGFFSSDRAIRDYASSIWKVHPLSASMTSSTL
jgi:starch phosphorylase